MKNILLIVKKEEETVHAEALLPAQHQARFEEICMGSEAICAEFTVKDLSVRFHCTNGSVVIIHSK